MVLESSNFVTPTWFSPLLNYVSLLTRLSIGGVMVVTSMLGVGASM